MTFVFLVCFLDKIVTEAGDTVSLSRHEQGNSYKNVVQWLAWSHRLESKLADVHVIGLCTDTDRGIGRGSFSRSFAHLMRNFFYASGKRDQSIGVLGRWLWRHTKRISEAPIVISRC